MANTKPITDEEFEAANRAGAARRARGVAVSVRYFSTARRLAIELSTGATLTIPVDLVEGLAGQPDAALADVMLGPGGRGLRFRQIDADVSVAGLMDGVFGSPRWMAGERDVSVAHAGAEADTIRDQFMRHFPHKLTERTTAHQEQPVDALDPHDAVDASLQRAVEAIASGMKMTASNVTVAGGGAAFKAGRPGEVSFQDITSSSQGRFGVLTPKELPVGDAANTVNPRLYAEWIQNYRSDPFRWVASSRGKDEAERPAEDREKRRTVYGGGDDTKR